MSTATDATPDDVASELSISSRTTVSANNSIYNEILSTSSPSKSLTSRDWTRIQEKAFVRWINYKLRAKGYEQLPNLQELGQGLYLYHLIDCLTDTITTGEENKSEYKYITPPYTKPFSKFQQLENLNIFLSDLQYKQRLQLHNIGPEDILDGNTKLLLGLIWTIILNYTTIENNYDSDDSSNDDELFQLNNKRDLLLHWCKKVTKHYDNVNVKNFTSSWVDGLAFCAILDYFEPELIKFDELDIGDSAGNLNRALYIAESIGICRLLDAEDIQLCGNDEKSFIAYISLWFDKFHKRGFKKDTPLKKKIDPNLLRIRLETFAEVMNEIIELKNKYLNNYKELNEYIECVHQKISIDDNNKDDLEQLRLNLKEFKRIDKLKINKLFNRLVFLKIQLNFSLRQFKLSEFPDTHLIKIESALNGIKRLENKLNKKIHGKLDELIKNFNLIANKIDTGLRLVSGQLLELCRIDKVAEQIEEIKLALGDLEAIKLMISKLEKIKNEVVKLTDSNIDTIEFKVCELKSKFQDLFDNCYGQLNFISEQFDKVDKIKKSLSKTRINMHAIQDEEEIKNFDFWGNNVESMIGVHQFKLIFKKFDRGEKGYLNKLEFRDSIRFLFNDLKDDEINEFFEILYKSNDDILRGVKLPSFVKILKKFYDLDDNQDIIDDKSSSDDEDEKGDDLIDMLGKFHLNTFKLVSDDDRTISTRNLKKIKVDDDTINKIEGFLEGPYDQTATVTTVTSANINHDKSFNYIEFFKDNEHSALLHDSLTAIDEEHEENDNEKTLDLNNVLGDLN